MDPLPAQPVVVAIAGPNGAGKTTFYEAHLRASGLRFVNADALARELGIDAYRAAEMAGHVRRDLIAARESFVFETVFSDPEQEKVGFLRAAADAGYGVVLCFIGLDSAELSDERVTLRTLMGGHDVPRDKLLARYPRSLRNLAHAMRELPSVRVFDNSISGRPHRQVAELASGQLVQLGLPTPAWFRTLLEPHLTRGVGYRVARAEQREQLESLTLHAEDGAILRITRPQGEEAAEFGQRLTLTREGDPAFVSC
jgi:predicted ABC-type ATPase